MILVRSNALRWLFDAVIYLTESKIPSEIPKNFVFEEIYTFRTVNVRDILNHNFHRYLKLLSRRIYFENNTICTYACLPKFVNNLSKRHLYVYFQSCSSCACYYRLFAVSISSKLRTINIIRLDAKHKNVRGLRSIPRDTVDYCNNN